MHSTDWKFDCVQLCNAAHHKTRKASAVCARRCTLRRCLWKMSRHINCITHLATGNMSWLVLDTLSGCVWHNIYYILFQKHLKKTNAAEAETCPQISYVYSTVPRRATALWYYTVSDMATSVQSIDLHVNMASWTDVGCCATTSSVPEEALETWLSLTEEQGIFLWNFLLRMNVNTLIDSNNDHNYTNSSPFPAPTMNYG